MSERAAASSLASSPVLNPSEGVWPVYGHRWAVRLLARAIAAGAANEGGAHHAYLLTGARQIGKSTLVRAFAQALFCTGSIRPCGQCRACRLMERGTHPDFRVVQPLSKQPSESDEVADKAVADRIAGKLVFPQARAIVRDANLRPLEGAFKVIHIQDAHRVADARFMNLLLKTLEEPPPHVILCVTATDRSAVLPTVVSRCQVLDLQPVERAVVAEALRERWGVEPEHAELLARLAGGRVGWAVEQARRPGLWQERRTRMEQLWSLIGADRVERLARAEAMASRDAQLFATLELWSTWWRDLLLVQSDCQEACVNVDCMGQLQAQARMLSTASVQEYVHTLQRVEAGLRRTVMPRLALDVLLLSMPHAAPAELG